MTEEAKKQDVAIPAAKDAMTREEADKIIALVKLDRAKLVVQRARFAESLSRCDIAIAEQDQVIADLERRVVGVDFPTAAEKEGESGKDTEKEGETGESPVKEA